MAGRVGCAVAVALVAAALAGGSASAAPVSFTTPYTFTFPFTDHSVRGMTTGDLNGDGHPDIVVGEFGGKFYVFLGDGHGGFQAPQSYAGQCPNAGSFNGLSGVAIGHFTPSGNEDVLVGCDWYTDGFVIYPGNGDGTLGAPIRIQPVQAYTGEDTNRQPTWAGIGIESMVHGTIGGTPSIAWSEAFAGGGGVICMMPDSDIATLVDGDRAPTRCSVYLVNDTFSGGIEFPPPLVLGTLPFPSAGSPWAFTMTPADAGLNNGSMRGVVYTDTNPPPSQAGFSSNDIEPQHAMSDSPFLLATGDLNVDGSSELLASAGPDAGQIAVYNVASFVDNSGVLVIPDPQVFSGSPAFHPISAMVTGDFDGDGHPDVAAIGGSDPTVHTFLEILPGDGTGALGAAQSFDLADFVTSGTFLATADFNGDGHPDLVTITDPNLTVLIDQVPATLAVSKTGNGSGSVTSSPAGIDCGSTCAHAFGSGASVTLTATAAAGSTFTGWSGGGCSGTGTCHVTLAGDTTVTAGFSLLVPTISAITPDHGGVGATVVVTGTSLTGATSVKVNGTSAAFSVLSSTQITLTVPSGATTGPVTVHTPGGTATSGTFTVAPPPAITSLSPTSGPVGTVVTIDGTNLDGTVGIEIGSITAVPTSVSSTQVVFTIPPGATTGVVRILNPAGSPSSPGTFTVTP